METGASQAYPESGPCHFPRQGPLRHSHWVTSASHRSFPLAANAEVGRAVTTSRQINHLGRHSALEPLIPGRQKLRLDHTTKPALGLQLADAVSPGPADTKNVALNQFHGGPKTRERHRKEMRLTPPPCRPFEDGRPRLDARHSSSWAAMLGNRAGAFAWRERHSRPRHNDSCCLNCKLLAADGRWTTCTPVIQVTRGHDRYVSAETCFSTPKGSSYRLGLRLIPAVVPALAIDGHTIPWYHVPPKRS